MKNNKPTRRLVINKQSVRVIQGDLTQVSGGQIPLYTDNCCIVKELGADELR